MLIFNELYKKPISKRPQIVINTYEPFVFANGLLFRVRYTPIQT